MVEAIPVQPEPLARSTQLATNMSPYKIVSLICEVMVALGVVGSGFLFGIKFVQFLTGLNKDVQTIMTNHLPHIHDELKGIREDFRAYFKGE